MIFNCTTFHGMRDEFRKISADLKARAKEPEAKADPHMETDLLTRASVWDRAAERIEMSTGFHAEPK